MKWLEKAALAKNEKKNTKSAEEKNRNKYIAERATSKRKAKEETKNK